MTDAARKAWAFIVEGLAFVAGSIAVGAAVIGGGIMALVIAAVAFWPLTIIVLLLVIVSKLS